MKFRKPGVDGATGEVGLAVIKGRARTGHARSPATAEWLADGCGSPRWDKIAHAAIASANKMVDATALRRC